jgi:hypothetical protein
MVELKGFEPSTYSLRTNRAPNCATAPQTNKGILIAYLYIVKQNFRYCCRSAIKSPVRVHRKHHLENMPMRGTVRARKGQTDNWGTVSLPPLSLMSWHMRKGRARVSATLL